MPAVELLSWPPQQPLHDLDIEAGDSGEVLRGAAGGEGPSHLGEGTFPPVHGLEGGFPHVGQVFEQMLRQVLERPFVA